MKFVAGTVLLALALCAVWEKMDIYRTGYAIEQLQARKKQSQQEQKMLKLEFAAAIEERVGRTRSPGVAYPMREGRRLP